MSHGCCDDKLDLAPIARLFDHPPCDWWRFVGCGVCNVRANEPCLKGGMAWPEPLGRPHAKRYRAGLMLNGVLWLLTHGFAADVLGEDSP